MELKHHFRSDRGFTLVELMTAILAASIVTLAATTLMLFGLRANNRTIDAMKQQNTSRILMQTLEEMTMDTDIGKVEDDYGTWKVHDIDGGVRFSYSPSSQTIYAGTPETGTPILENVLNSQVTLDEARKLLTFSVTTEEGTYSSSVFCRVDMPDMDHDDTVDNVVDNLQDTNDSNDNIGVDTSEARIKFLRILANQYKLAGGQVNNGLILYNKTSTGEYYSEWYIGGYEDNAGWNSMTPWCACFLSWGLYQCDAGNLIVKDSRPVLQSGAPRLKWYASVDDYAAYFKAGSPVSDGKGNLAGHYWVDNLFWKNELTENLVRPGDLILFDWNLDNDPSHIGAVLMVDLEAERVYTIEGNTSNRVGVRSYKLSDPRILGYGVIDWAASAAS